MSKKEKRFADEKSDKFTSSDDEKREEVDEEWFPKGLKPCVREIEIKFSDLDKDKNKYQKKLVHTGSILRALEKRHRIATAALEEMDSFVGKKKLRGLRASQLDPDNPSSPLGRIKNTSRRATEQVRGLTVTGIYRATGIKSPYKLLDNLMGYGLINSFQQVDNSTNTISEREKVNKELKNMPKMNEKKRALMDVLTDLVGQGDVYYNIEKKGKQLLELTTNMHEDDALKIATDEFFPDE